MKKNIAEYEHKFSFNFLKFLLYLVLLMPLLFWSIFLFPFITTKILYFRILVEIAFAVYVLLAFRYPELRPKWNWLLRAVWIYFGVVVVTSIFGLNFYRSFWGTVERGEGIVTILHFILFFTIFPQVFRKPKELQNYLFFASVSIAINALYALGQVFDLSFLTNTTGSRVAGTIGNASFFAAFLLFGLFLTFYLLQEIQRGARRKVLWLILFFDLFILYKTATRGALVALAIAIVFYLLWSIFRTQKAKFKILSIVGLVVFCGFAFFVYQNRSSDWVQHFEALKRLSTISLDDITTQSRLDTWQAAWKGWKDRLFFGYGYENFNLAFNKYFPARIFKDSGSQIWFDRAHNVVFDVGITSGLFGLLAYVSIFLVAFYYLFKLYRQNIQEQDRGKYLVLLLGLLAYFMQNLFVFDTQATYLMFYLTLGTVAGLHSMSVPAENKERDAKQQFFNPGLFTMAAVWIVMIFVMYYVNIEPAKANYYTTQGIKAVKSQTYEQTQPMFEKALSYGTYMDEEIRQRLVDNALEALNSGKLNTDQQTKLFQYLIDQQRINLKKSPKDVRNHLYLLAVLNRAEGYFPQLTDEAIGLAQEALKISPTRPQTYSELGQAYFFKKDFDKGLEAFQKAIVLQPEAKESHLNYLLAAVIAGRKDIVAQEEQEISNRGNKLNLSDYLAIARAYIIANDKLGAVEAYKKAIELDPKNPDTHARLAALYGDLCDTENAKIEVETTSDLNQSFILQGQEFLRSLETKCKK